MAKYKVLSEETQFDTHQYMVDTASDISALPLNEPGSAALIVDTSEVYILNNAKEWVKL